MELDHAEYREMYHLEDRYWWYRGRRELLVETVDAIRRRSGGHALKILDNGCGTGLNLQYLQRFGKVIGIDRSRDAIDFSRSRGENGLICALSEQLPIKTGTFDLVCALDVLEHIDDDGGAVCEAHRILKPGGYFILTVPAFSFLWGKHDLALKHKRRYQLQPLVRLLEGCGFSIEKSTYWNIFLAPLVFLQRIANRGSSNHNGTDLKEFPPWLDQALLSVLRLENQMIGGGSTLPFGVSAFCVCRKPGTGVDAGE
jgi:SAM-dependent methyltransferase